MLLLALAFGDGNGALVGSLRRPNFLTLIKLLQHQKFLFQTHQTTRHHRHSRPGNHSPSQELQITNFFLAPNETVDRHTKPGRGHKLNLAGRNKIKSLDDVFLVGNDANAVLGEHKFNHLVICLWTEASVRFGGRCGERLFRVGLLIVIAVALCKGILQLCW